MHPFKGSPSEWNTLTAALPNPHLLQTWEWSQVKAKYGWQPLPHFWQDADGKITAAAMFLKRTIPIAGFAARLSVLYIPKGPNLDWDDAHLQGRVLDDIQEYAKKSGVIFIKMDPDVELGKGIPGSEDGSENQNGIKIQEDLKHRNWRFSSDQIQFRNTLLIDLTPTREEMLARMRQKTRYNIRLSQKKGVTVRPGTLDDLPLLYQMYAETSIRDGFLIRSEDYYQTVWKTFSQVSRDLSGGQPCSQPLIAEVGGQPVAALSLFYFARKALYLFGMSRDIHREKMPTYLLQWEAICRAKDVGCTEYNLWGAPDEFDEKDRLWGVFRFKEGLGGKVLRTMGAWDYAPNPLMYRLYTKTFPKIMDIMRLRGKAKTRQSLGV